MKNLIVFVLPIVLLLSSGAVNAQGKSKEAKMNKGQVNSTIKKTSNPGNAGLFNDKDVKMEKKIRMTRKIKVIKKTRIHSLKNL
jgi:hypothetical protein